MREIACGRLHLRDEEELRLDARDRRDEGLQQIGVEGDDRTCKRAWRVGEGRGGSEKASAKATIAPALATTRLMILPLFGSRRFSLTSVPPRTMMNGTPQSRSSLPER